MAAERVMTTEPTMTLEEQKDFFNKVYTKDTLAAGGMKATRPNTSKRWNSKGEAALCEENADAAVAAGDEAVKLLARRKTRKK